MEFSEIVVKENPGLCRCCLSEGCYKDMGSEYTWMSENEVYADMLLECFDISITQHNEGPNGVNRLICEVCITRLRDACNFKKQVLDSEKKFIDMIGRGDFQPKMIVYHTQMKCEDAPTEEAIEETVEYLDDIDFTDDTEELKDASAPTVSDITASSLPVKGKRGRPKKNVMKTEKKSKIAKMDEKPKSSRAVSKENISCSSLATNGSKVILKVDSAKVKSQLIAFLQKTNAVPFMRHKNRYKCFYCSSTFILPSVLRSHTTKLHEQVDFNRSLKIWTEFDLESSLLLDTLDLKCRICEKSLSDFNDFNTHVSEFHNILFPKDTIDYITCFKLHDDVLKCTICLQKYVSFAKLLHHVEYHLHLDCRICDDNLRSEIPVWHDIPHCKPCSFCDKRFPSEMHRNTHLKSVHCKGFQCDFCSKLFSKKTYLAVHIRNIHYKERNITCDVCGKTFFDNRNLKMHKVRHLNTKPFECEICKKRFARNEALNLHLRIHNNDRRYICEVCGKAFVQWISLDMHKAVHTNVKKFKCDCGKAFKDRSTMRRHCRRVHQTD